MNSTSKDDGLIGARVELISWAIYNEDGTPCFIDDNDNVPPGTLGTVDNIDDAGTIHVKWDNGHYLGIVPPFDKYRVVDEETETGDKHNADAWM